MDDEPVWVNSILLCFFLDCNQFLYIVEYFNNRVTKWNLGSMVGQIVARGNGAGRRNDQLSYPHGIVVDRGRDYLFLVTLAMTALFNGRFSMWKMKK